MKAYVTSDTACFASSLDKRSLTLTRSEGASIDGWLQQICRSIDIGDTGVWVHLLQHSVDVDAVIFLSSPLPFLFTDVNGLCLPGFLGSLGINFRCHLLK